MSMFFDRLAQRDPLEIRKEKIEEEMALKSNALISARRTFFNKWPENLTSGIMFFDGQRITKEEFEKEQV